MPRRTSRFDHANFWVTLGAAVSAIGGILWSHDGVIAVAIGFLGMWWGLTLYLAHRHAEGHFCPDPEAHRLPSSGPAAARGAGPEVLSVLRQLRKELREAVPKLTSSIDHDKFWAAGTEGNAEGKGWRRNRQQLQGMSGMNPLWDCLEDAFERLRAADQLRSDRVFKSYRLQAGDADQLRATIPVVEKAISELNAKIAALDAETTTP